MADSSFFTDGGSDSGTFDTIEGKIAEAEAAKVAAQAAQAAAEQAEADAQTAESQAEAAKDAAELAQAGATGSETNSASSATSAGNHAADAQKLAVNPEDSQYTLSDGSTTGYSALHYNEKANDSAVAAAADASTATTKAGEAAASAGTASTDAATATTKAGEASVSAAAALQSEQNASQSETNAGQSETNAGQSETNAAASASTATTQAGIATTQAGIATTQAGTATTQAGTATTKAGEASNSASSALSAQTAAEAARDSALSALDSFDDRFLGVKSQAPTVDNDGDALVAGALYFDSSTTSMKVYSGSQWLNAYASLSGALLATNNLSDLNNAGTARTNLGLAAVASSGDLLDLGITDGTNGQALKTDGAGNFAFGDVATSTAWTDITGKPTTISGFGITDAFDGAYSSLTGAPSLATVATSGAYSDLSGTPNLTNYITNNVGGDFTVDNGTLFVDSSSNRVGINLGSGVTPTVPLNVAGTVRFQSTSSSGQMLEFTNYSSYSKLYRSNGSLQFQGGNTGNGILELSNSGGFTFDGNTIYHTGNLPTIPTNNNQLTNGAGYITSADGGNAATLDGIDSSQFLRSDASDTTTAYFTVDNHFRVVNPSSVTGQGDNATHFNYQDNGTNYLRGTLTYVSSPFRIASGGIQRSAHNNGHLEGGYNNIGANSTHTNPIFTIGSSYNPTATALSNMYGIGYTHTNASFIGFAGTSGWGMYVASDGDARVYLSGQTGAGYFTSNVTAYASDERLKTNITTIDNALDKVCQLRGVEYDWVDNITSEYDFHPSSMHETGVLAQNVASVIPDAVCEAPMNANYTAKSGENHEFLTVDKEKIIPVLIEAIKELKAEIEELKKG